MGDLIFCYVLSSPWVYLATQNHLICRACYKPSYHIALSVTTVLRVNVV